MSDPVDALRGFIIRHTGDNAARKQMLAHLDTLAARVAAGERDTARLDWLSAQPQAVARTQVSSGFALHLFVSLGMTARDAPKSSVRDGIDAAMGSALSPSPAPAALPPQIDPDADVNAALTEAVRRHSRRVSAAPVGERERGDAFAALAQTRDALLGQDDPIARTHAQRIDGALMLLGAPAALPASAAPSCYNVETNGRPCPAGRCLSAEQGRAYLCNPLPPSAAPTALALTFWHCEQCGHNNHWRLND